MKIIDAHMHFSHVEAFYSAAEESGVDYSYDGLLREQAALGIEKCVCMGTGEATAFAFPCHAAETPMLPDLAEPPPTLYTCLGINPHTLDDAAVSRMREMAKNPASGVVGFKIYAGYYHFHVHDAVYAPVYKLAAELDLTVAIHTGVTYSEKGLMEYSHPLQADRAAVMYRDTRFLLCHMGNPWVMDASEVAYKNRNVYLDISGLVEGSAELLRDTMDNPLLMHHYGLPLAYLNNYKKVLWGTDWPIVPLREYLEFCKALIPEKHYDDVFYNNAVNVYKL